MPVKKQSLIQIDGDNQYTQQLAVLAHTLAADEDAVEVITVHHDAYLKGILFNTMINATAADDYMLAEISKSGNFQAYDTDNADTIACQMQRWDGTFAQGGALASQSQHIPMKIFFRAGEKIYLNMTGTVGKNGTVVATLYWEYFNP